MGLVWKLSEILINQLIRDQQRAAGNRQQRAQLGSVRFGSVQLAATFREARHNERVWVVQVARVGRGWSTGWSTWGRVTLIHSTAHNLGKAVVRVRLLIGLNALSGDYANLRITQILCTSSTRQLP